MTTKNTLSLAEWKLVVRNVIVKPSVPLKFAFKTFKNVINYYYQIQVYGRKKQTLTHTKYLFVWFFVLKWIFFLFFHYILLKKKEKQINFDGIFHFLNTKSLKRKKKINSYWWWGSRQVIEKLVSKQFVTWSEQIVWNFFCFL